MTFQPGSASSLAALRRLARAPSAKRQLQALEKCELCSIAIPPKHPHLLNIQRNEIVCACMACALLFTDRTDAKFLRIPRRVTRFDHFVISDEQWHSLGVPIDLVFFLRHDPGAIAFYPSPAGATEAIISPASWHALVTLNPALAELDPKVEAILINRLFDQRLVFRVPIDACFRLVGLIRIHWRGLSGGTEIWKKVHEFFTDLAAQSHPDHPRAQAEAAHA